MAVQHFLLDQKNHTWWTKVDIEGKFQREIQDNQEVNNLQQQLKNPVDEIKRAKVELDPIKKQIQGQAKKLREKIKKLEVERKEHKRKVTERIKHLKKSDIRDKEQLDRMSKILANHSQWSGAANRASVITNFQFNLPADERNRRFDMLFTGDAFELGGQDSSPYSDLLKLRWKDFGLHSAALARITERPNTFLGNSDGNILTWLWQSSNLKGIKVGVLKVPHHGSSTTTGALFYRLVTASVYLISASATKHGHPRLETLATIIDAMVREDGNARPPADSRSKMRDTVYAPSVNDVRSSDFVSQLLVSYTDGLVI